jgi:ParB-like chromosome segregation protein Spo0J
LFPLLADDDTDFDALKSSIQERGQLLPILVQGDVLLDGRNRLRACLAAGVKPRIEEYSGPLPPQPSPSRPPL